jgi:transketolase
MRNNFADELYKIAKTNDKICALVADISPAGSMIDFQKKFPMRFINTGVAEQSMIGIAAGLALKGMRPFCYTIATFALFRPYEMIRVDLCYQNLPVTIIGMGAGLIYSTLGSTHHSMEDIAIASSLPNMQVLAPCDPLEMRLATRWCANKNKSPVYMRLGKAGEPIFTANAIDSFKFGKLRYINKGSDVAIITYGITISLAKELYVKLKSEKISCSLISCHTIKPIDTKGIINLLKTHKNTIIIEEHIPTGGISSKIKEIAIDNNLNSKIHSFTLKDKFIKFYGSYNELLARHGLSVKNIIKKIF